MKREYMEPRMEAIEMKVQQMLAASDPDLGGAGGGIADAPAMLDDDLLPGGNLFQGDEWNVLLGQ